MSTRSICSSIFCITWLLLAPSRPGLADMAAAAEAYDQGRYTEAARHWHTHAEAGDVIAQMGMGQLYQHGLGMAANPEMALHWYHRAARQGDAVAQLTLGDLLRDGFNGAPDPVSAWAWYRLAADRVTSGDQSRIQLEARMDASQRQAAQNLYLKLAAELR